MFLFLIVYILYRSMFKFISFRFICTFFRIIIQILISYNFYFDFSNTDSDYFFTLIISFYHSNFIFSDYDFDLFFDSDFDFFLILFLNFLILILIFLILILIFLILILIFLILI